MTDSGYRTLGLKQTSGLSEVGPIPTHPPPTGREIRAISLRLLKLPPEGRCRAALEHAFEGASPRLGRTLSWRAGSPANSLEVCRRRLRPRVRFRGMEVDSLHQGAHSGNHAIVREWQYFCEQTDGLRRPWRAAPISGNMLSEVTGQHFTLPKSHGLTRSIARTSAELMPPGASSASVISPPGGERGDQQRISGRPMPARHAILDLSRANCPGTNKGSGYPTSY
jgi:hypothetical protein